jgi:hypothetical protein
MLDGLVCLAERRRVTVLGSVAGRMSRRAKRLREGCPM